MQFLNDALLEHRNARFLRRHVDQDLVRHRVLGIGAIRDTGKAERRL
jgi:hypothetical protein